MSPRTAQAVRSVAAAVKVRTRVAVSSRIAPLSEAWRHGCAAHGRGRREAGGGELDRGLRLVIFGFRRLPVALVEIEGGVELRLTRKQILEARLVLERPVRLRPIVRQRLFEAVLALLLLDRELVERAQRMLDALHRADRSLGVEMRGV